MTGRRRVVRVPASSANLGPGYDVLAVALEQHLELEVTETGSFEVLPGEHDVPRDRSNLVVRAFEQLHPADGLRFEVRSPLPLAAGLGSSAAAIVAGLLAADHLFELAHGAQEIFAHAARLEGHPDNVAAAVYGGVVMCTGDPHRPVVRLDPPKGLETIAVIPDEQVPTSQARAAMGEPVPVADVVANSMAIAQLVLGLERNDLSLIGRGLADRLHQPRRRHLYPRSMELVQQAAELGAIGASISGAGPTVLVWSGWQQTSLVMGALRERCAGWAELRRLPLAHHGGHVPEL